jgi:hypothetical protein
MKEKKSLMEVALEPQELVSPVRNTTYKSLQLFFLQVLQLFASF